MSAETLPEPDHYCGSGPRFGATVTGHYTAASLREAVKKARREALGEAATLCDERSKWIANVIIPGLPEQFRGADSFANGSWQEAEACATAIKKLLEESQ